MMRRAPESAAPDRFVLAIRSVSAFIFASRWTPQRLVVAGALWTSLACNWPLWRLIWQLEDYGLSSRLTLLVVLCIGTAALLCALLGVYVRG